ncbi:MAG: RES domain-containing protein [Acetobacteraceae bacterium]|nr:RES domain-containing protein [Acetobacteraceae bacterium]
MLAPRRAHDPLSGEGAARFGGRWNPKDRRALYLSAELPTAVAEYEQELGIRPGTFCAYDVAAEPVVDFRDDAVLAAWGVEPESRFAPWKTILLVRGGRPPGWDIADRLFGSGMAGILTPSSRMSGGTNLVLWRWNDSPSRSVVALDPQRDLPRDQSSWPVAPARPLR